jgi:citrate synthase/citryl-CoA lyase
MTTAQKTWRTAVSDYDKESINIGGYRVRDLMKNLDFGGVLFVLYQQRIPSPAEAKLLNALMISVLDHGIVAPSAIARIVAASGVPLQACVAAGILTIGDVHGGAGEQVAHRMGDWVKEAQSAGVSMARKAQEIVSASREKKERIEGYGHPLHPEHDERVDTMVELARQLSLVGPHLELALAVAAEIEKQSSRRIPLNVDGAMAGILMDLGFDWRLVRTFVFVPRAAGIAAHAVEENVRERGWRVIARAGDIDYDGPALRDYPSDAQQGNAK